jgi:hypothetical protein
MAPRYPYRLGEAIRLRIKCRRAVDPRARAFWDALANEAYKLLEPFEAIRYLKWANETTIGRFPRTRDDG